MILDVFKICRHLKFKYKFKILIVVHNQIDVFSQLRWFFTAPTGIVFGMLENCACEIMKEQEH